MDEVSGRTQGSSVFVYFPVLSLTLVHARTVPLFLSLSLMTGPQQYPRDEAACSGPQKDQERVPVQRDPLRRPILPRQQRVAVLQ